MRALILALTLGGLLSLGLSASNLAWGSSAVKKPDVKKPARIATVRFSYEKWSRAGQKRFVLVPMPTEIKAGGFKDQIRSLFKILVSAKRSSYGDARLAFKDDAAKTGVVYVYLDPNKKTYHPIVQAETVYTFTEHGASKVVFPKVASAGKTRDDVSYPAYVLTLPLWQALPPAHYYGSLVKLPDGNLLPQEIAVARLRKNDEPLTSALWSYVDQGSPKAALAALAAAKLLALPDLEVRLLPVLQKANTALRAAAIEGLAGRDTPKVNRALRKVMDSDPDETLRDKAASLLSQSKDPKFAASAQYHALRSKDPKIAAAAATTLGASKLAEASKQLLQATAHADESVRGAAIAALQKRGEHAELAARLQHKELAEAPKIQLALALAAGKDPKAAHAALMWLAVGGAGPNATTAAARLADFGKREGTLKALGQALRHKDPDTRRAAAGALAKLKRKESLPILAAADADDAESGEDVRAAVRAVYGAQKLDFVLKETTQKVDVLRRAAVAALGVHVKKQGKRAAKKVVPILRKLATDADNNIRAAAARSFGIIAEASVRGDLLGLATDDAIEVKRAVAFALRGYPDADSVKHLLAYASAKDPELLANAIETLGVFKEKQALDAVVTVLNHDDVRVRRAATGALVSIGGTLEKRMALLSFFSERVFDKDVDTRLKALEGLQLVKDRRVVTAMAALVQDPVPRVRQATLMAMASTGDPSAVEAIATALEDDDPTVRRVALEAFAQLGRKEALPVLAAYQGKEKDKALASAAAKVLEDLKKR